MNPDLTDDPDYTEPTADPDVSEADKALLNEIRDNYQYAMQAWQEARDARRIDMRYLSGDPWDEDDRKGREDAGRPCINHDELNQYVFQCVNNVRQAKKGIKIEPDGNGATDKTAEFRQNHVRAIEYKSQAAAIYASAYQAEVEGSYGFCRITRRYISDDSFDQEIVVKPISNPDSVLYDPDCKEPDWSDARWCFIVEPLSRDEFKRRWPKARVTDFGPEDMRVAPDWINDKTVLTAEYWKIITTSTTLYLLEDGTSTNTLPKGKKAVRQRTVEKKSLKQYFTNGVEILEDTDQPGKEIPIPVFVGLERWFDDGTGPKRSLYSLVRFARDPQMSMAYLCSQQMEEAGLSPKTPYVGYTGQFETDSDAWDTALKIPHARLQADPVVDGATGQVLPLPRREQFTPNFAAYEVAKDSCRRAIQAAMGISPLPTAAQRQNEKSGVALERIQNEQSIGSFHFMDGYDRAIARAGRIIESWVPVVYDTEREIGLRKPDDTAVLAKINTEQPYPDPETGEMVHYPVGDETHAVTISDGPSYDSQRRAVSDFLDTLIAQLPKLPVAPPQAAKLLALAIQMKELGPKGDEMAEIIAPENPGAAQQQAQQFAQLQQGYQSQQELILELQAEIQKLALEKQGHVVDNEYKMSLERLRIEADLAKSEISTKAQSLEERIKFVEDAWKQLHAQAHDVGMQAAEQQHAREMAPPMAADQTPEQPTDEPMPQAA